MTLTAVHHLVLMSISNVHLQSCGIPPNIITRITLDGASFVFSVLGFNMSLQTCSMAAPPVADSTLVELILHE